MKKRLCEWLYRHKRYRLARWVSPSIYYALVGEEISNGFTAGFAGLLTNKQMTGK